MYAVVQVGSYQYQVSEGSKIETERLNAKKGETFSVDKVLLYVKDNDVRVGQPFLQNVKVTAEVNDQIKAERKLSYQYRLRKDSARKVGSRQNVTVATIKSIEAK